MAADRRFQPPGGLFRQLLLLVASVAGLAVAAAAVVGVCWLAVEAAFLVAG